MSQNHEFTEVKRRNRGTKTSPTYTSATVARVNDQPVNRPITKADKFGDVNVYSASMELLLYFLLRQLGFLSSRQPKQFGSIVSWASTNLKKVGDMRDRLRNCLDDIAFNYPSCAAAGTLGCQKRFSPEGNAYSYSHWYSTKNPVSQEILEENTMTLGEARVNHLLDQICYRINRACERVERNSNSDHDFAVLEDLNAAFSLFDKLRVESIDESDKLSAMRQSRREAEVDGETSTQRTPRRIVTKREVPPAPKKQSSKSTLTSDAKPRKLNFEEADAVEAMAEPVAKPKSVVALPPSKPVSSGISYANIAKGVDSTPSVPKEIPEGLLLSKSVGTDLKEVPATEAKAVADSNPKPVAPTETTTTSSKKAKKRANQKKRKAAAKAVELVDITKESPTEAVELSVEASEPTVVTTEQPMTDPSTDLVEVQLFAGFVDGLPKTTTVVMTRSQYASIQKVAQK
ncbi:mg741 protein [Tupanvirus deep ocean]|uniref:Mg741 protein n=2 Tax=Tupanvirus TaxID=2094720 RepID=A0AC62A6S1_9VIRU|nr:mg741 protein [Tupanvirus deep ocean]QKU33484.1 mg741 protein [Tupanvirus deep ocean]